MPKKRGKLEPSEGATDLLALAHLIPGDGVKFVFRIAKSSPKKKRGGRYVKLHGQKDVLQSLFSFLRFPISVVYVSNLNFNFKRLEATDSDSYLPSAIRGGGKHLHRVHKCLKSCQRKCFT